MPRAAALVAVLSLLALLVACGGGRKKALIIEQPAEAPAAAETSDTAADDEATVAASIEPEADTSAAAIISGEHVPSRIAILVVPGLGYRIQGERVELEQLDRILARMAKHNRYADIQIRTHDQGSASMVAPVIDLTERHGLVNVTLYDGR